MGYHDHKALLEHPNIEKLCTKLDEIGGTLVLDIGQPGTDSHNVKKLQYFAKKYQNMKLVVCHLLSMTPDHDQQLKEEMEMLKLPNVWYDIAAIACNTGERNTFTWARKYLAIAKEIAGEDRLMWGSDIPITLADYPYEVAQSIILDSGIFSEDGLQKIFYNNAMNVYTFK